MHFTYSHSWALPASLTDVFRALTDETALTKWFAEGAQVEPRDGGVYRFWGRHTLGTPPQDAARQTTTRFERDTLLAFEWPINDVDTDVIMRLAPATDGTSLSLTHNIWGDLRLPRQREHVDDFWRMAIRNLVSFLAGKKDIALPDYFSPRMQSRASESFSEGE